MWAGLDWRLVGMNEMPFFDLYLFLLFVSATQCRESVSASGAYPVTTYALTGTPTASTVTVSVRRISRPGVQLLAVRYQTVVVLLCILLATSVKTTQPTLFVAPDWTWLQSQCWYLSPVCPIDATWYSQFCPTVFSFSVSNLFLKFCTARQLQAGRNTL